MQFHLGNYDFFSVSMEFEGDFNEVVADVGLLKLQKKMRETINGALFISKWRVQSVMCSSKGTHFFSNSIFDPLSLRFSKFLATFEPQIGNFV